MISKLSKRNIIIKRYNVRKYMKKCNTIIIEILKDFTKNELHFMGNELTYRMFIAMFPLLILIISFINSLNLDGTAIINSLDGAVPIEVLKIIEGIVDTINVQQSSKSLITISFLASILSASSGFIAVIRGVNRSFGDTVKRSILMNRGISVILVLMFSLSIITMQVLIVFGDSILLFLIRSNLLLIEEEVLFTSKAYSYFKYLTSIVVVLLMLTTTYKLAAVKKLSYIDVLPGSIVTLVFWLGTSTMYNFYVRNYVTTKTIYGALGGVFILVVWLNVISSLLLLGSQVNATLYRRYKKIKHN